MRCNSPYRGRKKRQDNISCMVQLQAEGGRIACRFRIIDKITTKDFLMQDTLALGLRDEETRIFGVYLSIWSGTKDTIFHWHWNTALYFNFDMTCARPLHLVHVLTLPQDDSIRWLKKLVGKFWVYSESIRDRLDLWKMGAAFDIPLRCENSRLFNAFAKSLLQAS